MSEVVGVWKQSAPETSFAYLLSFTFRKVVSVDFCLSPRQCISLSFVTSGTYYVCSNTSTTSQVDFCPSHSTDRTLLFSVFILHFTSVFSVVVCVCLPPLHLFRGHSPFASGESNMRKDENVRPSEIGSLYPQVS